jgi:hypothetical protein
VRAAVDRALAPWNRRKGIEKIIQESVDSLADRCREVGRKTVQKYLSRNKAAIKREQSKMTRGRALEILGLRRN